MEKFSINPHINSKLRQETLDLLRFPLAVIVVIAHTFSYDDIIVSGTIYKVSQYTLFQNVSLFIDAFLRGISVPIYFFISGYVFFNGVNILTGNVYRKKLNNRIRTLLIPYIIWNALAIFFIVLKQLPLFESFLSSGNSSLNLSFRSILNCFWIYDGSLNPNPFSEDGLIRGTYEPVNISLWYLRDLMIICLSTPILYWLIRKLKVFCVYLFLFVYIVSFFFKLEIATIAGGFFFFSWGAYMSISKIDMMKNFAKYFSVSVLMYFFNSVIYIIVHSRMPELSIWIKFINSIFALLTCFNVAAWLLQNTKIKVSPFLIASSFFLYVSHWIFLGRLRKVLFMVLKPNSEIEILFIYMLTVFLLVLFLLSVFYLLKRYTPLLLKIVAGRK